jgi:hypothetical protein
MRERKPEASVERAKQKWERTEKNEARIGRGRPMIPSRPYEDKLVVLRSSPGLVPQFSPKFHYVKRRFPVASKCRQMHEVLNVDEIKN